ncbi:hypothetical protein BCV70DRAFT_8467 [Testicularia cyperi]|uniref:Secreted protein n=1 Tax=Testicularia cyperi TaxID=1882483 RepID=A0A317XYC8_9BASI|nr:hypothetical protein BCV70DRAFT_8467 [Testicularia cyperi]
MRFWCHWLLPLLVVKGREAESSSAAHVQTHLSPVALHGVGSNDKIVCAEASRDACMVKQMRCSPPERWLDETALRSVDEEWAEVGGGNADTRRIAVWYRSMSRFD